MPLSDAFNSLRAAEEFDVVAETIDIINKYSDIIIELVHEQLEKGKDGLNAPVTLYGRDHYAPYTIALKEKFGNGTLGKETGFITNYMSGNFYASMNVKTEGMNYYILSDVAYFEKILNRSGAQIMELTEENRQLFHDLVLIPELQERFTKKFNNGV